MNNHLEKCPKYENSEVNQPDMKQSKLSLRGTSFDQGGVEILEI
jgi:hypothetical protein